MLDLFPAPSCYNDFNLQFPVKSAILSRGFLYNDVAVFFLYVIFISTLVLSREEESNEEHEKVFGTCIDGRNGTVHDSLRQQGDS